MLALLALRLPCLLLLKLLLKLLLLLLSVLAGLGRRGLSAVRPAKGRFSPFSEELVLFFAGGGRVWVGIICTRICN